MLRLIAALLAIFITGPALGMLLVGGAPLVNPYTGPCDPLGCAEAYNVNQAAIASYSGPLFQLSLVATPSSHLDVSQTAGHLVDLSTWSAFCGGVQSNCMFSKIYAHINTTANDLVFPTMATAPSCSVASNTACACLFQLNGTTGLPEVPLTAPCKYTIANDAAATGVTGGSGSDIAIIATGRNVQTAAQCCNFFGANHRYDAADTPGTDFGMQVQYSNTGAFANCSTSTGACLCADLEINTICGANFASSPIDLLGIMTWAHVANTTVGTWNGHSAWSQTPPVSMAPGNRIHLGAGGDLTQPAPFIFRAGYVLNSVPTGPQQTALFASVQAFYSGLSFP